MRRVKHIFVRALGAFHDTNDVLAGLARDVIFEVHRCGEVQRNRLKAFLFGCGHLLVEILTSGRKNFLRYGFLDPAIGLGLALSAIL